MRGLLFVLLWKREISYCTVCINKYKIKDDLIYCISFNFYYNSFLSRIFLHIFPFFLQYSNFTININFGFHFHFRCDSFSYHISDHCTQTNTSSLVLYILLFFISYEDKFTTHWKSIICIGMIRQHFHILIVFFVAHCWRVTATVVSLSFLSLREPIYGNAPSSFRGF